jgi:hypothetical protein
VILLGQIYEWGKNNRVTTKIYYLESWLHFQSLAPTNLHWARVVGYGLFFLCAIHKEGLCLSGGDIDGLMMKNNGYPSSPNF